MSEFAFDLCLTAVIRIKAENASEAREKLELVNEIDASLLTNPDSETRLTEVSLAFYETPRLFEVDGQEFP